jgi:uncharacterized OB-fold protein
VDVEAEGELMFEDFDAIFINIISGSRDRNMLTIRLASPLLSEKCRFKPCFVTQRLKGWLGNADVIVDGYAVDPTDHDMAQGIEEVYSNMRRMNFLLGPEPVRTRAEEFFRLCRYAISRGQFTFNNMSITGLNTGYMSLYYYTLWSANGRDIKQAEERLFFHSEMLKMGYIRKTRFLEKVHLCPNCGRSHILYFECCPKCRSSHIGEEAVLHHFRCANVSPESSYAWDGELRCPKCHHMLHHIGVDYDRPASVYTCQQCGENFMYPDMRVLCTACKSTLRTDELRAVDVEEYEFTPEGIRAFAANDVIFTISQVGFLGYSSMRDFLDYIRMFAAAEERMDDMIIVLRFFIFDPTQDDAEMYSAIPPIAQAMSRFSNYKNALWGNNYYFMITAPEGNIAQVQAHMEFELKAEMNDYGNIHEGFQYEVVNTYFFHYGEDAEPFIRRLSEDR